MKRKIFIFLLALTSVIACAFALTACAEGGNEGNPPDTGNGPDTSNPSVPDPDHEHNFGDWVVLSDSTCTEAGEKRRTCNCGVFETETQAALGHDLKSCEAKPFSCTEDGWTSYEECRRENCGYNTKVIIRAHHLYKDYYCTVCGKWQGDAEVSEDGKSCIFAGVGDLTETDVVIPAVINGLPVTAIGDMEHFAFKGNKEVTSVVIPDTVTSIGPEAFEDCENLKTVVLPDNIVSIGAGAFEGCDKFEYNKSGQGDKGNYIGSKNNDYLVLMNVEKDVVNYSINDGTKMIYYQAFDGCEKLQSIVIPDTVTELGVETFMNCTSLESVTFPENGSLILDGTFIGCTALKNIEITESVVEIGSSAFMNCENLASVTISSSVTVIGGSAFYNCTSLKEITIPETVKEIKYYAFFGCSELETVNILAEITEIEFSTFQDCSKLSEIVLPATLTRIGDSAFSYFGESISRPKVYFYGDKEQWEAVNVGEMNNLLEEATVYFYPDFAPANNSEN